MDIFTSYIHIIRMSENRHTKYSAQTLQCNFVLLIFSDTSCSHHMLYEKKRHQTSTNLITNLNSIDKGNARNTPKYSSSGQGQP